jgi:hypothetical protein
MDVNCFIGDRARARTRYVVDCRGLRGYVVVSMLMLMWLVEHWKATYIPAHNKAIEERYDHSSENRFY